MRNPSSVNHPAAQSTIALVEENQRLRRVIMEANKMVRNLSYMAKECLSEHEFEDKSTKDDIVTQCLNLEEFE